MMIITPDGAVDFDVPVKRKLRLDRSPLPAEQPDRTCALCGHTLKAWQFETPLSVCNQCGRKAPIRWLSLYDKGMSLADARVIQTASTVIKFLEWEAWKQNKRQSAR